MKCEFGESIVNKEEDKPCKLEANFKIIDEFGGIFYLCKKHLKKLKSIENFKVIKIRK
jgi:hypothetical protein